MRKQFLQKLVNVFAGSSNHSKTLSIFVLVLFACGIGLPTYASITITSVPTASVCPTTAGVSFTTLSNIVVTEGVSTDISSGSPVLTLQPPTGWVFNTATLPTFLHSAGDISAIGGSFSSGNLVVTLTVTGTTNVDNFTIVGLQVEPSATTSFPGTITPLTATGFNGVSASTTDFGNLYIDGSPTVPGVAVTASPIGAICSGSGVTFTPAPTNGGAGPTYTWYVNGSSVGSGSPYTTSTLSNGSTVSCTMLSNAAGCVYPASAFSNTVTMTVNPLPTTVTVSGGGTYCGSTTLTAANGGSGTMYWQGTTSGGTSTATPVSSMVVSSSGTYYFRAQSASGCWGIEGSATVTINTVPTLVSVSGGGTYCGGPVTITTSGGTGGTMYFQGTTSGGTSTGAPATSESIASSGTYYFNSESAAGCWGTQGSATVTINSEPTASVGVNQTVCSSSSTITLAGSIGGSATSSTWTASSGTFSNASSLSSTYTPSITSGSVVLTLTTNNPFGAPCVVAQSTMTVTVNQAPTDNAGANQTVCSNGSITLAGSISGAATAATWTASSGTFSNASSLSSTYTPTISSGVVTLTLTSNNPSGAPCAAAVSTMNVTVLPAATDNAGSPETVCSGSTITLGGSIGGAATSSTWTASSGSFGDATNPTSTYTPSITSGNVTLTLTSNNPSGAPCAAAVSSVIVTVDQAPSDNAGSNQTVCSNGSITLSGSLGGSATTSTWTAASGTFSNASSVSSTYTPTISSGVVTLTLTSNDPFGGVCTAAVSTMNVTVLQAPTDNAGSPETMCSGSTITLGGSIGGAATSSMWTASSGSFGDATNPTTTYTPSISSGNVTLTLTSNNPSGAPCAAAVNSVIVTVDQAPSDNAGSNQTVCSNGSITLGGTLGGSATTSTWTAGSGTFSNASSLSSTYTPTISSGVVTLTLTSNDPFGGVCTAAVSTVNVTVLQAPTDNAGTPQTVCSGSAITLGGSIGGAATSSLWTASSGTFSDPTDPTATYTPSISTGNVTLTLTSNNPSGAPCLAATNTVVISVDPAPTDNAGVSETMCSNGTITLAGSIGGSATTSTWTSSDGGVFSNVNSPTSTYTPAILSGNVTLTLTTNNPSGPPCSAAVNSVVITVNEAALVNAGPNQVVCQGGTVTLDGSLGGSATTSTWSASDGVFSDAFVLAATYTPGIDSGIEFLTITGNDPDGPGPCAAMTSTVAVTVNKAPTDDAGPNQVVCSNGSITLDGSIGGSATASLWTSASGTFSNSSSLSSTYTPSVMSGPVVLTLTSNNPLGAPCPAAVSTMTVTVDEAPTANAGTAIAVCDDSTVTLNGTIGGSATTSTWSALDGGFSDVALLDAVYTPVITSGTVTLTLTTNSGPGPCAAATSTVNVTVNQAASANAGLPQTICAGGTVTLAGSFGGSATSANWNASSGLFSDITSMSSTYTPSITSGTILLTLTTNNPGAPCASGISTVPITVQAAPATVTVTGGGSYCTTETLVASNGGDGTIYYEGTTTNGTSTVMPSTTEIETSSGTYYFRAQSTAGCWGTQGSASLTISALPLVYTVTGGGAYCSGGSGEDVGLTGSQSGVSYQLYNDYAPTGTSVLGGGVLTFGPQTAAGYYTVIGTNTSSLCSSDMTGGVAVAILPLPGVFDIMGGGSYCSGDTGVDVSLNGSEVGVNYQLFISGSPGAVMTGTGLSLDFGNQVAAGTYNIVATSASSGCTQNMSGTVSVSINAVPNVYGVTGSGTQCAGGAGIMVGVNGSQSGFSYQLYNGSVMTGLPGTGSGLPFNIGAVTTSGTYSVSATNPLTGCTSPMTGSAVITINPLPMTFMVEGGGAYCSGGVGVDVSLSGSEGGVNYTLFDGGGSVSTITGGGSIDYGNQTAADAYFVVATNATTSCSDTMSDTVDVLINLLPTVYNVTGGGGYCSGTSGADVQLSGSQSGVNYQIFVDGVATGSAYLGTGAVPYDMGNQATVGTYTVSATDPSTGCVNNMSGSVSVFVNAVPTAYTVTGGGSDCAGGTGFDLGLSNSQSGSYTYSMYNGSTLVAGPTAGSGLALDFGTQTVAGTYTVVATNTSTGCYSEMLGGAVINVYALPTAYTITGGGAFCAGGSGAAIYTSGTDGSTNYQLYSGGTTVGSPVSGTGTGGITLMGTVAGTYSVVATSTTTGCTNEMSGNPVVTINPAPATILGAADVCISTTTTLTDATGTGTWSSSNPAVGTISSSGLFGAVALGTCTVTYTLGTGCYAILGEAISAPPVVSAITGSNKVCEGDTTTQYDATAGGTWSSSATTVASIVGGTGLLSGVSPGTVSVTYTVSTVSGCVVAVSTIDTVKASPTVGLISGATTTLCADLTLNLSDATAGGTWSSSNIAVATITSSGVVSGITPGTVSISYTVSNSFGCTTAVETLLAVGPSMPASIITPASATICHGQPVTLSVSTSGSGTFTYQWYLGGILIPGANSSTFETASPGAYDVQISNGTCSANLTSVAVSPAPDPIVYEDSVGGYLYTSAFSSYQWYYDSVMITGATTSIIPLEANPGDYFVVVADANGCTDTSAVFIVYADTSLVVRGVDGRNVRVYPNPATTVLNISAPVKVQVSIAGLDGRIYVSHTPTNTVDITALPEGVYIISVYDDNMNLLQVDKFVKVQQ